ncbi:MAG: substrate-binding domain-containing protein, partial [Oscillospiraceae bacterium]|nr:substrate-binding domain-containing protein [Oscillospiraceae bacterium]
DRYFGGKIPCVSSDNYGGGYLAAKKLAENGGRQLACFRVGPRIPNEPDKRKDGFLHACEEMGLPCVFKLENDGAPYSVFEDFLREHMCGGKPDFDGIFCVTDHLAHRIRGSLQTMGVRVPEDVQIIGFDGIRNFGDLEYDSSTIVQPLEELAETCVNLVLDHRPEKAPSLICLPVRYAYGETTKN